MARSDSASLAPVMEAASARPSAMRKYCALVTIILLGELAPSSAGLIRNVNGENATSSADQLSSFLQELIAMTERQNALLEDIAGRENPKKMSAFNFLPHNYDKTIPPGLPNDISVALDIYSIPEIDEIKGELKLEIRVTHFWVEHRLNATMLRQPVELVPAAITEFWTPDSYIHHAKDAKIVGLITKPASLRINPDKMIKYTLLEVITIACPMEFKSYPMDIQECKLELQAFGYNRLYNNYTWRRPPQLLMSHPLDHFTVDISREYTFDYRSDGMRYPGLGFHLRLRRHLGYHLIQTYIPSVFYVIVAYLSFIVPSDIIPGRMVLCVTTLLTLTSMFNTVSYLKALDLWVFACLVFVFFTLAEYAVILLLTSRSAWQRKVDVHVRDVTGAKVLRSLTPAELLSVTMRGENGTRRNSRRQSSISNGIAAELGRGSTVSALDSGVKDKERLAYTIEWISKFAYPAAFVLFNIAYWSYYLQFSLASDIGLEIKEVSE